MLGNRGPLAVGSVATAESAAREYDAPSVLHTAYGFAASVAVCIGGYLRYQRTRRERGNAHRSLLTLPSSRRYRLQECDGSCPTWMTFNAFCRLAILILAPGAELFTLMLVVSRFSWSAK